ncbi:MAG: bacteriohemerythrin [Magnetococcales bacterium]|nr:bacteriohemerythrin [Magnetococcales bacterium]
MIEQEHYMPEKYRLGHPSVDMQHELLFVLYNEILESLESRENGYDLVDIFAGLNMYVINHFQFEEELMETTGYHDKGAHMEEHRMLKANVGVLHDRFNRSKNHHDKKVVAQEIADFLVSWLEHHIAEVDRHFCQFLLA